MSGDKKKNSDKWDSYNAQKIPMVFKAPQNIQLNIQLNFGITQL